MNNEAYETLLSMGFSPNQCQKALEISEGDLEYSINLLLSGPINNDAISTNRIVEEEPLMIETDISQYTFTDGTSACSCIALNFASEFLNEVGKSKAIEDVITPDFLNASLVAGVEKYKKIPKTASEHKSPEEVMTELPQSFNINFDNNIMQGVLGADDSPFGLKQTLMNCMNDEKPGEWVAVVLTKTPETLCVCMPKRQSEPDAKYNFILIDSHPRPQLGSSGCYALLHTSFSNLLISLRKILPITNIEGMSSLMAEMYNSFDAYPIYKSV